MVRGISAGAGERRCLDVSIDAQTRVDKTQYLFMMKILSNQEQRELDKEHVPNHSSHET